MAGVKIYTEGAAGFLCNTATGGDPRSSVEGINTSTMQDGATAFVRATGVLYRFSDTSLLTPNPPSVILPAGQSAADPGRWLSQGLSVSQDDFGFFAMNTDINNPTWSSEVLGLLPVTPAAPNSWLTNALSGANWQVDVDTGLVTYGGPGPVVVEYHSVFTLFPTSNVATGYLTAQLSKNDVGVGTYNFDYFSSCTVTSSMANQGCFVDVSSPVVVEPGDTLQVIAYCNPTWRVFEWRVNVNPLPIAP